MAGNLCRNNRTGRVSKCLAVAAATSLVLTSQSAFAHHVMGNALPSTFGQGLLSGLAHPIIGLDHLAFVAGLALLGVLAGTRIWPVLAFIAATIAGVGLHLWSVNIAGAELIIALSVALAALFVLLQVRLAWVALAGVAALFGIVHGYAYGESIVGADRPVVGAYLLGLAIIQSMIAVAAAYGLGFLAQQTETAEAVWSRLAGAAMAVVSIFAISSAVTGG